MKTLSDIKKAMTVGSKWHTVNHISGKDFGVREVSISQTTQFALKTIHQGVITDSWLRYPKIKDIRFNSDKSFTVMPEGRELITYTLVEPNLTIEYVKENGVWPNTTNPTQS